MTQPSAKILADSMYLGGHRLTTMEVTFHRFVLAEFNTHRVFSRNSASSRAIPVSKQLARVRDDLAMPLSWPAEQKGMQGGQELTNEPENPRRSQAMANWDKASKNAIEAVEAQVWLGLHKSVTNRLLEPFMWHTVVVTSTAWQNFFDQRCSPLAQPEIRAAAELMRQAYLESKPQTFANDGSEPEWHLPYIQPEDCRGALFHDTSDEVYWSTLAKVSAARCARVSYLTQDGRRSTEDDLTLYERLVTAQPAHWSPLEHVATPWSWNQQMWPLDFTSVSGEVVETYTHAMPKVGNLTGWRSLRTEVEATTTPGGTYR